MPNDRTTLKVTNWDPANGLSLNLRTDVKMFDPTLATGWDGEGVADFFDTLELLAIQLVDENDQPIPGVTLTTCLADHLACRVDQALQNETPRFVELLEAVGN